MKPPRRRSIRLPGYDYARPGAYFITICTHERVCYMDDPAILRIAEACWLELPSHFPDTELDAWVIMPNHLHGILILGGGVQLNAPTEGSEVVSRSPRGGRMASISPGRDTLAVAVRTYKAAVTTACRRAGHVEFAWQRNYYEHVIRNEGKWVRIRRYIANNPLRWDADAENPDGMR